MILDKPMPLRTSARRARRGPAPAKGQAIVVVALLAFGNWMLFFGHDATVAAPSLEERLHVPALVDPAQSPAGRPGAPGVDGKGAPDGRVPAKPGAIEGLNPGLDDFGEPVGRKVAGKLKRGQTILKALGTEGIDGRTAMPVIKSMEKVFDFRYAQVSDRFEAWLDDEGQVQRFRYVQSPLDVYEVGLEQTGLYASRKVAVPTEVEVARVGCSIKSSLYGSLSRCGEGHQLGSKFIDLFAWDIDFFTDVRQGDELKVIVEKISVDGRFLKYGRILGAEYVGKFGRNRIVHYTDPEGNTGYYTAGGRAVRKQFLKSPLKYTRVSSERTTGMRASSRRKASPVIYTAAEGTPVWAMASGTVVYAGVSGSLGNTVTIKHDSGYTTTYGHLAKLGRTIKVGALVNQKSVIGRVGQSGRASEPKLLFSVRKKGKLKNPLKLDRAEADPVSPLYRDHFDSQVQELLGDMASTPIKRPQS